LARRHWAFYVTVKDGPRTGWLLGPYGTHDEALANVERGKELAEEHDRWAHFYFYGTTLVRGSVTAKTVFGK